MKNTLSILFLFFSCSLLGQEKIFQDYLRHFKEGCPDTGYYFHEDDSFNQTFEKVGEIPPEYVKRYIADKSTSDKNLYRYSYGPKLVCGDYVIAWILKDCDDFVTKWGRGIRECFAIVYSSNGQKLSQMLIGTESDGQFFKLDYSPIGHSLSNNNNLAMIVVYETTLLKRLNKDKQTYQGVEYVRIYNVDQTGIIRNGAQWHYKDVVVTKEKMALNVLPEQYFPVNTSRLNNAYQQLIDRPQDATAQKNYFDAFPGTWEEFIMTYRYIPDKEYDLTMFFQTKDHLDAWYHLNTIPDSLFCQKLIHIATGGRLSAMDAAQELRGLKSLLSWTMKSKMDAMFSLLSGIRKGHQFEFWSFYWASIHYHEEKSKELKQMKLKYEKNYSKEVEIMCDAYKYFHNGVNCVGDGFEKLEFFQE